MLKRLDNHLFKYYKGVIRGLTARKESEWKKNGESEVLAEGSKCISSGDDPSYIEHVITGLCSSSNT